MPTSGKVRDFKRRLYPGSEEMTDFEVAQLYIMRRELNVIRSAVTQLAAGAITLDPLDLEALVTDARRAAQDLTRDV